MRNLIFITLILLGLNVYSQSPIKFDYDASGNMILRHIQVLPLRMAKKETPKDSVLNFSVFPNPAKDQITIEGPLETNTKEAQVLIYNTNGSLVSKDKYYGTKKTYSLTGFTSGIYFLEVKYSKKQSSNYKILITE